MSIEAPLLRDNAQADPWFESLTVEVSSRFMHCAVERIDAIIEDTQRLLCEHFRVDRSTLWQVTGKASQIFELTHIYQPPDTPRLTETPEEQRLKSHDWVRQSAGMPPVYARMDAAAFFPWIVARVRQGQSVAISSLDDFPPEAALDREILERYGTKSTVIIPLRLGDEYLGSLTFAMIREEREWPEALVRRFELVGHLFTHALARKANHRVVRESEYRLRAILDNAEEAIITMTEMGIIESANVGTERLFRYSAVELVGLNVTRLMPEPFRSRHESSLAAYLRAGSTGIFGRRIEAVAQRKDGSRFPIELSIGEITLDHRRLFTGFIRDITLRRQGDEALRDSELRFRTIADSAPVLIWMTNPEGECNFVNKPYSAFTGRESETAFGAGWTAIVHPDDRQAYIDRFRDAADARQPFVIQFRLRRHDGVFRWMVSSGVPYFDARGTFAGYIGSCVDITEQREAQKAAQDFAGLLIKSQEDHRARLARELHDDVTQRLARLAIDVGRFRQAATLTHEEEGLIGGVADGLVRLSRDVHALSYDLHPAALIDLGLEEALRAECEQVQRREAVAAELKLRQLPRAIPRESAIGLFRIAQESIRNAVRHGRASRIEVSLVGWDGGIQLVVQDNGAGFDPHCRRSTPSLGLASMRERARLLNGDLDIESAPGHGTTIAAWVPLKERSL